MKKGTVVAILAVVSIACFSGIPGAVEIDPTKFYSLSNSATSTALWTIDPYTVNVISTTDKQVAKESVLNLHLADGSTPNFMTNTIAFSPSNVLYGWDTGSKRLYTINLSDGQIDYIGDNPTINSSLDTQWINGMSFVKTGIDSAILYGISGATDELYTINTSTGKATVAGLSTVDIMHVGMGVNFNTNELYAVSGIQDGVSDVLLKINPGGSPIAQVVGSLGIDFNDTSAEFDQYGNLYAVKDSYRLYALNLGTGDAAWVGNLGYGTEFHSTNLAHPWTDTAPVPEPGTLALLGSGLLGLAGYGRKKIRK